MGPILRQISIKIKFLHLAGDLIEQVLEEGPPLRP